MPTEILLAGAVGPLFSTILILPVGAPFPVADIVGGVTYAALMPYVGPTVACLSFDARVRMFLVQDRVVGPEVGPAQIER